MDKKLFKAFSSLNMNRTNTGAIYGLEVVKQDVLNLVMTRKGAFPGDVRRGLLINDYVFSPQLNTYDENLIVNDAREQLSEDPRYRINSIELTEDAETHTLILSLSLYVLPFNQDIEINIPFRND